MWNDDDAGYRDDGGNNSMFASPTQPAQKSSKPKCIADVTIKQILESKEEGIRVKDAEIQVVKIVGIVKMVEVTTLKIRYVISDHTGTITGFVYLDDSDTDAVSTVVENTYCSVTGSVRTQGDSKHIMIFAINPVTDFNFILAHMLSVVHMPLKLDSLGSEPEEKSMKTEMLSSYGGSNSDIGSDVDPRYRRVFDVISRSMSENGMNIDEIQSALPTRLPADQIRNALEYLVGEGHVFTTIDENHYKSINSNY